MFSTGFLTFSDIRVTLRNIQMLNIFWGNRAFIERPILNTVSLSEQNKGLFSVEAGGYQTALCVEGVNDQRDNQGA